ncbi:MAG: outer-membrane lipoprotein carrier protein LolA [Bacteroides sp.]|nr:outer-membrane lipoprotein carrier protein LolA [Bacteroides sp.]
MKKLFTLWMLALLPHWLFAQSNANATEILDKVFIGISDKDGIRLDFEGTENGFLLIKEEKFYLNNGNIQSWYDGKTQWSYVAATEEVNISQPTPEELRDINPYFILKNYKNSYNYIYKGNPTRNGGKVHEIVLTPKNSGTSQVIRLFISKANEPQALKVEQNGQTISEINITSYQTKQKLEDGIFRFNKSLYPHAEIIDLR